MGDRQHIPVKIHLDAQAPMDGAKLYQVVQKIDGAQFKPGDPTTLLLHRPKQSAAAICAALPQIVYMLADCIQSTT